MKPAIYLGNNCDITGPRDPCVFYHDGYFYHIFSKAIGICVKKAKELEDLANTAPVVVFKPGDFKEVWAPELHIIDNKCYIYVAMDDGDNYNHRMYVLENNSSNPQNPYTLHGQLVTNPDRWAIDGSLLRYNGKLYFIWSGWEGLENVSQEIYIQEMSDPFTCVGERVQISKPEYDWEKGGCEGGNNRPYINEGPFAVYGKNHIHIVYSASGSWSDYYCLGLLTFSGGDILDPKNWVKKDTPILSSTETAVGPGHASFFEDPRNHTLYVTYHLFNTDSRNGWADTHAMIQEYKMVDDYPVLDKPINHFRDK